MDSNASELRLASFGFPHDAQDQTATPAPGRNLDAEPAVPRIPSNPFSRRYSPPLFLIPKEEGTGLRQLRVLFIHGFESGPKGRRSVALSRHFECYTPWMRNELEPILRWRQNRVVHACIALFVLLLVVACLAAYTSHHMGGLMLSIPALLVGLLATYWVVETVIVRFIAHPAIQGCLQKQRDAILTFKPDVVVGSSWGGGIATYLMMEGAWRGPTILLAPAGGLISRKARFLASAPLRIPDSVGFVHVVHSKIDRIVPAQDSVDLIQRSSSVVEGDEQQPTIATSDDQDMRCAPGRATSTNNSSSTDDNHNSSGRIRLTLIDDDDHPLSRAMREEKLREAVIEAYTFVHPRTK